MKCYLRKTLSGFAPNGEADDEACRRYKVGSILRADLVQPRSYKHHCLFMALLDLTFQNQERYTDGKMFRRAVALKAGHVDQIITLDGEAYLVPLPYDYDTLPDEKDFTVEFGKAMAVCQEELHNMGADELEAEVSRYAAQRYGIAA